MYVSFAFEGRDYQEVWGEEGVGTVWAVEFEKGADFVEKVTGTFEFEC